jgi:hypothetical protein
MEGLRLADLTAQATSRAAGRDSLDTLDGALPLAAQLTSHADALVDHFVTTARPDGRSWTEIGSRLGVSKQPPASGSPTRPRAGAGAPARGDAAAAAADLPDRGRRHAHRAGATEVGFDHLLAGLLAEGVAAGIVDRLAVTAEAVAASAHRLSDPPQPARERATQGPDRCGRLSFRDDVCRICRHDVLSVVVGCVTACRCPSGSSVGMSAG